jgi:hypothetical protein
MTDSADTVVLVPMLGRDHRVEPLVESIRATSNARILFCCTPGDDKVLDAVDRVGCQRLLVPRRPVGDYARKINYGYRATTEPLMFTAADDLEFHPGWLEAAKAQLRPGIGVVGTNDLGSPRVMAGDHSCHFLITREYADKHGTIDGPGAVMYEGYPHEWVDDELVGTAKKRGAYEHAHESHVEHLHPNWGKAPLDELYMRQSSRIRLGRGLYLRRRRRWM